MTSRMSVLFAQYCAPCLTGIEIPPRTFYIPVTFSQFQPNSIDGSIDRRQEAHYCATRTDMEISCTFSPLRGASDAQMARILISKKSN